MRWGRGRRGRILLNMVCDTVFEVPGRQSGDV